ncbi:MAG: C40 family peptidase [Clostridia bacterium]|nr:C40 family peptidase [Clostridia bacterium]
MKKLLSVLIAAVMIASLFPVLPAAAAATPETDIIAYNLINADNVYIAYLASFENVPSGAEKGVLVWTAPQADYTYANAEYQLSSSGKNGVYDVFEFRHLSARKMTDDIYAVSYIKKDAQIYYGSLTKYSVLQYVYNKMGKTSSSGTTSVALLEVLASMLDWGASAQRYFDYNTDRLASENFYQIKIEGGTLPDGTRRGLFKEGDSVTVTTDGTVAYPAWVDDAGLVLGNGPTLTFKVGKENRVISAKKKYVVCYFGDSVLSNNYTGDYVRQFAAADGILVNSIARTYYTLDKNGTSSCYDPYELYDWTNSSSPVIKTNSAAARRMVAALTNENQPVDFFVMDTGRGRTMFSGLSFSTRSKTATRKIYNDYLASKGGKMLLLAPPGFQDGSLQFDVTQYTSGQTEYKISSLAGDRSAHNTVIKNYANSVASYVGGNSSVALIGDAVEYFIENYSDTNIDLYEKDGVYFSRAGAYFEACLLYSYMFGKQTSGIEVYGVLDEGTAKIMQAASDAYLAHAGKTLTPHVSSGSEGFKASAVIDPRLLPASPDVTKTETYHANYDALLSVAQAYYARGALAQYDDSSTIYKRFSTSNLPENATVQKTLYLNCATFVHNVYKNAFGFNFGGYAVTWNMLRQAVNADIKVFSIPTGGITSEYGGDVAAARAAFMSVLEPGDVIIKYSDSVGNGHAMLYLGNGMIVHSTSGHQSGGTSSYDMNIPAESYEARGTVCFDPVSVCIDENGSSFMFEDTWEVGILRPFLRGLTPTEQTTRRMNNLSGLVVSRLTSAPEGTSVSPGADVTFTFSARNDTSSVKTVEFGEALDSNLTFKHGDFTYYSAYGKYYKTLTIAPGETCFASYTATVKSTVADGTVLACASATANGMTINATPVLVKNSFTPLYFAEKLESASKAGANDYALISGVYSEAFGYTLPFTSASDLFSKVFTVSGGTASLNTASNTTRALVASNLYGGKDFREGSAASRIMTTAPNAIMPGDVIYYAADVNGASPALYLCVRPGVLAHTEGGAYLELSKADSGDIIESLFGQSVFCVLRPAFAIGRSLTAKKAFVFGDATMYGMQDILMPMMNEAGYSLTISATTSFNLPGTVNSYNINELFNYNDDNSEVTGFYTYGANLQSVLANASLTDYFIIPTGSNWTLIDGYRRTRALTAMNYLQGAIKAHNPNAKLILMVSPPYEDGYDFTQICSGGLSSLTSFADHNAAIEAFKQDILDNLDDVSNVIVVAANDSFAEILENEPDIGLYLNNIQNAISYRDAQDVTQKVYKTVNGHRFPTLEGQYLIACNLFKAMTGKAPAGLSSLGKVTDYVAEKLQGAVGASSAPVIPDDDNPIGNNDDLSGDWTDD